MNSRSDTIRRPCPSCGREMTLLRRFRKGEYDLNPPWRFVRHNTPSIDGHAGPSTTLCDGSYIRLEGRMSAHNHVRR